MKKIIKILATIVVIFILMFLVNGNMANAPHFSSNEGQLGDSSKMKEISKKIEKMTIRQKVGQLLIAGFENNYLDDHARKLIVERNVGGFNLLKRNVSDYSQTKNLISELQSFSMENSGEKLFIGADQEGGQVIRFSFLKELTPQSKISDRKIAEDVAYNRGIELCGLGVNMVFAPLADYVEDTNSYIYSRTFKKEAVDTANLASAMVSGFNKSGIISVVKHFPGYGNSGTDPHKSSASLVPETLYRKNLDVFEKIINSVEVPAIMTAHVKIAEISSDIATLSKEILSEELRKNLGFGKVVMTDDFEMASALNKNSDVGVLAVKAINAGNDMIISTYSSAVHFKILDALERAVEKGEITMERLDESVKRILLLKASLGSCGKN